jgi:hypothetical protein
MGAPEIGCVVVYGSRYPAGMPRRSGHIGIVVGGVSDDFWHGSREEYAALRVVHCSSTNDRRHGQAIRETGGLTWSHEDRPARFLRYLRFSGTT